MYTIVAASLATEYEYLQICNQILFQVKYGQGSRAGECSLGIFLSLRLQRTLLVFP